MGAEITGKPATIKFPSGAVIKCGHLKDDQAYTKYQGHEYQRMLIEELTQIPDEKRYLQLISSCRSTVEGLKARIFATTNPGGAGHFWVKSRFVDPSQPGEYFEDKSSGRLRLFIPATVDDNPALMKNDPDYVKFLDSLKQTDEQLWKAWRLGDWESFAGQFFREWRPALNIVNPFIPNKDNYVFVAGIDWGYAAPFACEFGAIQKIEMSDGRSFNRLFIFNEVTGTEKTPKEWSKEMKSSLESFELKMSNITWLRGDPAMWSKGQDGSDSISDQFMREGILIRPANNDRINGWMTMHKWLSIAPDGKPYLQVTKNCKKLIETIPLLVHSETKVEDIESTGTPDHWSDGCRYLTQHLRWIDGRVGGVIHGETKNYARAANMKDDGQLSVNLDSWEV